ncbi:MAG: hypothetical protein WEB88_13050 [Gemmatimonadota bacterium]
MRLTILPALRAATVAALLMPLAGCAAGDRAAAPSTVRDSAGIQIVESAAPLRSGAEERAFPAEPALQIGELEEEGPYLFHSVRTALLLQDGGILVADGGARELRYFDAGGEHIRTVGGQGGGPGEFMAMAVPHLLPGDSVVVPDMGRRSIHIVDPDGAAVRTWGRMGGGVLPGGRALRSAIMRPDGPSDGYSRDSVALVLQDQADATLDTIARLPGGESWSAVRQQGELTMVEAGTIPFGLRQNVENDGERIYHGDGSSFQVTVRALDGTVQRLARIMRPRLPVDDALWARYRETELAGASAAGRSAVENRLGTFPRPDSVPAFMQILTTRDGGLWLQHYPLPGDSTSTWSMLDADGRWLGDVTTPPRFRVTDARADTVLGVWRDELDVSYIRVYHLTPRQQP